MDVQDGVVESPHKIFDNHGPCDIANIAQNIVAPDGCEPCSDQCDGDRRAVYMDVLMGYMSSNYKLHGDLKHELWCSKNRKTRRTGDGTTRPCAHHYRALLAYKLPCVTDWNDAILSTLPTCSECGKVVKWSERQASYLFRQHLLQGSDFKDPEAIVAEMHRLGAVDAVAEREAVRVVRECDRRIALAQQQRALYLRSIASDTSVGIEQLADLLHEGTVAEIKALRT